MIPLKLARHHLTKNKTQTLPFILSNSMWVMITYIFFSMIHDTNLKAMAYGTETDYILKLGLVFVVLIATLSTFYAERLLSKQRMQELGLYSILGLTKHHLRQIVFWENILFYLICMVIGSAFGFAFSKFAFMGLKSLIGTTLLHQTLTWTPLLFDVLVFAVVFSLIILFDFWELRKVDPIDLWGKTAQPEKEPKSHLFLALLGLLILAIGYYISVTVKPTQDAFSRFIVAVLFVFVGSYLVFITTSISGLKALKKRPKYYYQPNHFISVSNMLYRMKQNGAGLASISLLCTSVLVALTASFSLIAGEKNIIDFYGPRDVQIVAPKPLSPVEKQHIKRIAKQNHITMRAPQTVSVTTPVTGVLIGDRFKQNTIHKANYVLSSLDLKQYNRLQRTHYRLARDEVLVYVSGSRYDKQALKIQGKRYRVKPIAQFSGAFAYGHLMTFKLVFVVAANKKIAHEINPYPEIYAQGFNIAGTNKQQKRFSNTVQQTLKVASENFTSKPVVRSLLQAIFGSLLFMGILISLVMICATVMIIYYKQVSEGYADQKYYRVMSEIGLSRQETTHAIRSQVLTVFLLPIVGAVINLGFALPALKSSLSELGLYDSKILTMVSVILTAVLLVSYMLIYMATAHVYRHIVNQGMV